MLQKFCSNPNFSIEVMEMEEDSGGGRAEDDPVPRHHHPAQFAALLQLRNPARFPPPSTAFMEDNDEDDDELVDLQELSTLSDGDLCMSRQLTTTRTDLIGTDRTGEVREQSNGTNRGVQLEQKMAMDEKADRVEHEKEVADPPPISSSDCIGELVTTVKGDFLPTEAVEQFLRGMNGVGAMEAEAPSTTKLLASIKEETPSSSSEMATTMATTSQTQPKKPKNTLQRGSSSESRPTASPAEFAAPPPPPIVISPQEVDHISITLEKNQQCACKDCGKLFNSVWYLKQHAVKHSNDRPFKCRFCMKTYKFRSNLYQHKCPERSRLLMAGEFSLVGHPYRRRAYNRSSDKAQKSANAASSSAISINTAADADHIYSPNSASFGQMEESSGSAGPGLLMVGTHQIEQTTAESAQTTNYAGMDVNVDAAYVLQMPFMNGHPDTSSSSSAPFDPTLHKKCGTSSASSSQIVARDRELPAELIEQYMRRNRHRVFNCRKCKLYFPSQEYFARHIAYHNELEEYKYCCEKCPERFQSDAALQSHQLQHADQSPHCCAACNGVFRSALALRRHKDNWRQCHSPPFGTQFSLSVNPIDQYSFVESDLDEYDAERSDVENEQEELLEEDRLDEGEQMVDELRYDGGELDDDSRNALSRKTTRDSGYQGSDTYSPPTESHSPASTADQQHNNNPVINTNALNYPKRDEHGRFAPMKSDGSASGSVTLNGGWHRQQKSKKRKPQQYPADTVEQYRGTDTVPSAENGNRSAADKNNNNNKQQKQRVISDS